MDGVVKSGGSNCKISSAISYHKKGKGEGVSSIRKSYNILQISRQERFKQKTVEIPKLGLSTNERIELMNKTTVIFHSADFDGIFCREIARKFLPDAELIGWDFKDPKIPFPSEGTVYILDLSPDCFTLTHDNLPMRADGGFDGNGDRLIWIDHHKSSIEKHHTFFPGYRIDGVAAARLCWQYFTHPASPFNNGEAA